jgi:dihydropteroate synthase
MIFRARQFEFRFPRPALVMGVVNVTPDSFSDGGKFFSPAKAVAHALELVTQGAEILDIGGESTRPGAEPVSEAEELRRVIPVVKKLAAKIKIPISVDTTKPAVARAALATGASIVNDVAAAQRADPSVWSSAFGRPIPVDGPNRLKAELQTDAMWKVVSEFRAGYICMHAQGSPRTMQKHPAYTDVVREVGDFFRKRLKRLNAVGISPDQVVFDPGIGFGKTLEHNLQLLANLRRFTKLKRPLMLGVSRKSFIGKLLGAALNERLPASLACATLAVADGAQIIRAHDVAETVQAVRLAEALLARKIH